LGGWSTLSTCLEERGVEVTRGHEEKTRQRKTEAEVSKPGDVCRNGAERRDYTWPKKKGWYGTCEEGNSGVWGGGT